jgi:prephenate dehydrogenase
MTTFDSVAIIGLGLIGGSVARDLAALGVHVVAYDPDETRIASAIRANVVSKALNETLDGVDDVDIIVLATPVDEAIDILRRIAPRGARTKLITDVGSTKTRIVETAHAAGIGDKFVGAHPMAGDHRSGWEASRPGLFVDAPVYLCANREVSADALRLAHAFWSRLGSRAEEMAADEHDLKLAWTSHLPHMVSASLALALARAGVDRGYLGPGGRDVTRLAGSSPEMWTAIALDNAPALEAAMAETEREIASLRAAIKRADREELNERLAAARRWAQREAGSGKGEGGSGTQDAGREAGSGKQEAGSGTRDARREVGSAGNGNGSGEGDW